MSAVFDCLELTGDRSDVFLGMSNSLARQLAVLSVRPDGIQGRINSYTKEWRNSTWFDTQSQQALSFDFGVNHPEQLLVHCQAGGGTASRKSVLRFTIKGDRVNDIRSELPELPSDFDAIHIRSTDYQSNFRPLLRHLAHTKSRLPLLVCSDSNEVLEEARSLSARRPIITFPGHPVNEGIPLHSYEADYDDAALRASAQRLLAEMYAMTSARTLYYGPVFDESSTKPTQFSGFSSLLGFLTRYSNARQRFFGVGLTGANPRPGKIPLMVRGGENAVLRFRHVTGFWVTRHGFTRPKNV